ncbi:YiiX/YebB-like N1pC/P60 family cysteine hydrolase [Hoeflea prorocentri]|uniref:YiiX/YebB-like N1pC/P60 family cysteine hydrolase n=1 Tax=Hoeflea prorocentri TaxID=1922333 RepID=A0A9X3UM54_9HYPH|nr:YiiX/YebB-like N1pC/P60 family cysteine hydrolase [Hoeflea prorocentri]MCY6383081.1 YiiX/YebB-like N1pC/P60 family cysteine hydrolase [Hoeflea prorocentri]MDA5400881.1 YiiX/YebB-like N1pC/P60 family cysteine hydrolase [Hoeflea prorocentri]
MKTVSKDTFLDRLGHWVAGRLRSETSGYQPYTPSDPETLERTLQPGDILLVEGNQKISAAIKYLTQSTWSHAALYVGDACGEPKKGSERLQLIEVVIGEGCVAVPLRKYATYNTRICRPVGLTGDDRRAVVDFMVSSIGTKYDLKNIFDMLRYFLPTPPVPVRWRRRMLSFGSGDPTRAICSSLIAQAFQGVYYPILPEIRRMPGHMTAQSKYSRREILHIRHHSLFTPRDFDLSPYFRVVKPTLEHGFDYKALNWHSRQGHGPKTADREFVIESSEKGD